MAKDQGLSRGDAAFEHTGELMVPLHPDDEQVRQELEQLKARDVDGIGLDAKLRIGAEEAVDSLRRAVNGRNVPWRDSNAAAEKLLTAAKVGGFDKGAAEGSKGITMLFGDAEAAKGLLDGMSEVAASLASQSDPKPTEGYHSFTNPAPAVPPSDPARLVQVPEHLPPSNPQPAEGRLKESESEDRPREAVSKERLARAKRAVHKTGLGET